MFERLVGLQVGNEERYQKYREAMLPILHEHGGSFGYDFRVSEVLINQSGNPINRVFTINFPDEVTSKRFFSNSRYLAAREQFFDPSVECATVIAQYQK